MLCKKGAVECEHCHNRSLSILNTPKGKLCMSCSLTLEAIPAGVHQSGRVGMPDGKVFNTRDFQIVFEEYIDDILSRPIPETVVSYIFNLAEPWCIEVVGCGSYDTNDPDWGCDEVFRGDVMPLELPDTTFGPSWEDVLSAGIRMVEDYLARDSPGSRILKSSVAVAVGFVDGDTHLIRPK